MKSILYILSDFSNFIS